MSVCDRRRFSLEILVRPKGANLNFFGQKLLTAHKTQYLILMHFLTIVFFGNNIYVEKVCYIIIKRPFGILSCKKNYRQFQLDGVSNIKTVTRNQQFENNNFSNISQRIFA